jgi:GT2 family glycosyltransferase
VSGDLASDRPSVSVIVPFAGSASDLERLIDDLGRLTRRDGDQLIVADNGTRAGAGGVGDGTGRGGVCVVAARGRRAPGYARNCGARVAGGEWLLFIDADTGAPPTLLDDYFDPAPRASTAVLAGGILDVPGGRSVAARHSAARGQMSHRTTLERAGSPYAQTANCAVRRSAFADVGGFSPDIRAGEDADLCFRLTRAGWSIEQRPHARVEHRSRETVRGLLGQLVLHGSGAGWLNHRYAGEFPPPRPRELAGRVARSGGSVARGLLRGDREGAQFALLDLAGATAFDLGRLLPNKARER